MQMRAISSNFPKLRCLALGIAQSKTQTLPVRRPAEPESKTRSGDKFAEVSAVDANDEQTDARSSMPRRQRWAVSFSSTMECCTSTRLPKR